MAAIPPQGVEPDMGAGHRQNPDTRVAQIAAGLRPLFSIVGDARQKRNRRPIVVSLPIPKEDERMARRLGTVFVWCAALLVTTLSAQDRQIGGVGITIYEDVDFKGRNATAREAIADLTR